MDQKGVNVYFILIFVQKRKMRITLSIKDKYVDAFMTLIKKLNYVEIKEITDEKSIEQKVDMWKRVAQDEDMISMANEGLADYKQTLDNYETM